MNVIVLIVCVLILASCTAIVVNALYDYAERVLAARKNLAKIKREAVLPQEGGVKLWYEQ
jgi:hypothetical protein